jgi:molybdate transport system regulatory protein
MQPRSNFWIENNGKVVLSEWRVALLEAVERTGSIRAAADQQGVHFRVAWRKLQEMEEGLGVKLTDLCKCHNYYDMSLNSCPLFRNHVL